MDSNYNNLINETSYVFILPDSDYTWQGTYLSIFPGQNQPPIGVFINIDCQDEMRWFNGILEMWDL